MEILEKKKKEEEEGKKVRRDVRWSFELLQRCNKTTTTLRTRTHTVIYQVVSRDIFRGTARKFNEHCKFLQNEHAKTISGEIISPLIWIR